MKRNHSIPLTAIAAAVLSVYGANAVAEEEEIDQYIKFENTISIGVGDWSDDRLHEGLYDGMRDEGGYGSIDAEIRKRDDDTGTWTRFSVRNLGMDNVEMSGSYEKQGDWGIGLSYSQTPRYNQFRVNTGLQGIGTETQTVTPVTPGAGTDYLFEMRRDATSVTFFKQFRENLELSFRFKNEEKEGDRHWGVRVYPTFGATGGSFPAFTTEPIDSTTRQFDALLSFAGEKLNISGGYYGSWYDNHNTRVDVIGTAGGINEMSLPPDNLAHQLYMQGNYQFSPTTRGLFKVSYTQAEQDDPFMSTTNNGVAAWAPLPSVGSNLDAEVATTEAMLGVTARPMKELSLVAKLNYWDRQDNTPVRIDGQNTAGTVFYHNNPFSNTKTSATAEGTYRLQGGYSVTAGLDYLRREREFDSAIDPSTEFFSPYRTEVDEKTVRIGARRSLSETLNGSLSFLHSERDGSTYVLADPDWNDITPVHIADRERDKWKLMLDWNPMQALGLQFNYSDSQDDYPVVIGQQGGLRSGEAQHWSLDANYLINDDWQVIAWYSQDYNKSYQTGVRGGVLYQAYLDEEADSFGLGLKGQATERLAFGLNIELIDSDASYRQDTTAALPGGTVPLPDIANKLSRLSIYGDYTIDKNSSIRVDLIEEEWKTDDWTWAFSDDSPFSFLSEGTQVINPQKQSSTFVGVRYIYKFR